MNKGLQGVLTIVTWISKYEVKSQNTMTVLNRGIGLYLPWKLTFDEALYLSLSPFQPPVHDPGRSLRHEHNLPVVDEGHSALPEQWTDASWQQRPTPFLAHVSARIECLGSNWQSGVQRTKTGGFQEGFYDIYFEGLRNAVYFLCTDSTCIAVKPVRSLHNFAPTCGYAKAGDLISSPQHVFVWHLKLCQNTK